jgi:gluconolactonase
MCFSPDEKYLYIADSGKKIWLRYRVTDGALLLEASHDSAPGTPDGIRVDKEGSLYGAGPGGVWIISAEGKHLGTINVPERVSNVAWGDKDGKALYITASTSVYRIKLQVPGMKN